MLFHDVHHAFPNAVGTLSQRGRFHGWEKVHDAAAEVLHRGLWKPNGDEETQMQKTQKKRSLMMKQGKWVESKRLNNKTSPGRRNVGKKSPAFSIGVLEFDWQLLFELPA